MRHREVRMRRLRLALFGWILSLSLVFYAWSLELIDLSLTSMGLVCIAVLLMLIIMHIAIRSGWSERFRDPSLTLPHMLVAIVVILFILSRADEARSILLMLFFIAFVFGVFQLKREQYILVAAISVFGFTLVNIGKMMERPEGIEQSLLLLELGVFAAVMGWFAFIGSYVARLRRKLSLRNRELEIATQHLTHIADHDELTGLPNRRRLLAHLENVREAAEASGQSFCVAVIDLDHFKHVNDERGHQVGDDVLAEFARRAREVLRGEDAVMRVDDSVADIGRFGGEEFLCILPGTDPAGARLAADRLREDIASQPFATSAGPVHCTISVGVAAWDRVEPVHHTISRADAALYRAKNGGRNRVEVAEGR